MYKKILVPLDGTEFSRSALAHAEALAQAFHAELILLRVLELNAMAIAPGPDLMSGMPLPVDPDLTDLQRTAAQSYVASVADDVARDHVPCQTLVEWGGAADEIAACAAEHGADLIVMAMHDRGGLERWLLGSVAETVLHHVHVPVLLVKSPAAQKAPAAG